MSEQNRSLQIVIRATAIQFISHGGERNQCIDHCSDDHGSVLSPRSKSPSPLAPQPPCWGFFFLGPPMRKPITYEVVVSVKENSMTIENDVLREDLRAWMRSPALGLQEYSSDPSVQRRVGRMIANFSAKFSPSGGKVPLRSLSRFLEALD